MNKSTSALSAGGPKIYLLRILLDFFMGQLTN